MSKATTTTRKVDYFRLPRPLWRKLKKCLPKKTKNKSSRRGGRPRASDRAVINGIWYVLWTGCQWKAIHRDWFGVSSSVIHERFQRWTRMGIFEKLMKRMAEYYARECGGVGWRWQAMDSNNCVAPLGGEQTGKNPTDRGKLAAKINLIVDERGAPTSIALTGANRHDKVSAIDLIASIVLKRPAHKEQHLCADKSYDAQDVREFVASEGYAAHIKVNPRRSKDAQRSGDEQPADNAPANSKVHPARRWMVERTISWLSKRRGLRTRWAKKAENWLSFVQLACAHILLNLAVLG
ncbi:MAG TPA: IS5 family transposase [Rubrobacter sp.]|nr:IS5 family transposase [Rubrobacter sp.]